MLALAGATLFLWAAKTGRDPLEALRAILRRDALPGPAYPIGDERRDLFPGPDDNPLIPPEPVKPYEGTLIRPVPGPVTSPFGMRWGRMHYGVDIACPTGTPVKAAGSGRVDRAGWAGTAGNRVGVKHEPSNVETVYMHLSSIAVRPGEGVVQGQVIGLSGSTGRSTGPHLHFEVHVAGTPVDPLKYIPR